MIIRRAAARLALPLLVAWSALPGGAAGQQALAALPVGPESSVIAVAEAEGASLARAPEPALLGEYFQPGAVAGTADRRCIEASGRGPVRSGDFVIGGDLTGEIRWTGGTRQGTKIWWVPLAGSRTMEPLVVRGRLLEAPGSALSFETPTVAFPTPRPGRGVAPPEEEREWFFPSDVLFPRGGRWLVVATSGPHWGCFVVTQRVGP